MTTGSTWVIHSESRLKINSWAINKTHHFPTGFVCYEIPSQISAMKSNKNCSERRNIKTLMSQINGKSARVFRRAVLWMWGKSLRNNISNEINICFNEIFTIMLNPLKLIIESFAGKEQSRRRPFWKCHIKLNLMKFINFTSYQDLISPFET